MSARRKSLLIVNPVVFENLPATVKRRVEREGFLMIPGNPDDFKTIDALTLASHSVITQAALESIQNCKHYAKDEVKQDFATRLLAKLTPPPEKKS